MPSIVAKFAGVLIHAPMLWAISLETPRQVRNASETPRQVGPKVSLVDPEPVVRQG